MLAQEFPTSGRCAFLVGTDTGKKKGPAIVAEPILLVVAPNYSAACPGFLC